MPTTKDNIKNRNSKMMLIDENKLRNLLAPYMSSRDITLSDISTDFGYGHNYLSNLLRNGVMSIMCCKMLEKEFGIKYEDYKYIEPESEKETINETVAEVQPIEHIVTADSEALVKAIKEVSAELFTLNKKLDDLFAQTQLNGELLQDIKDNTRPYKPYSYKKGSH